MHDIVRIGFAKLHFWGTAWTGIVLVSDGNAKVVNIHRIYISLRQSRIAMSD